VKEEYEDDIPPGDDVCPTPPPVDEEPPTDRFCDLVLMGGVASGVVYPWAIVELARAYRFRNIGGTSVGAMAAALAAAAEYGRRQGALRPFETLRRTPAALAKILPDGRTRMLSLFQANDRGKRLVKLWGNLARGEPGKQGASDAAFWRPAFKIVRKVSCAFWLPCLLGALAGLVPVLACALFFGASTSGVWCVVTILALLLALIGAIVGVLWAVWSDVQHGLVDNGLGLCKGGTLEPPGPEGERPGISEWLHGGIQLSAGLKKTDSPLTFRDLWCAPAYPGAAPRPCTEKDPPGSRAINLQMITSNATHGRPYRLPLADETSRLFFDPAELADYFTPQIIAALVKASQPYAASRPHGDPPANAETVRLRELPGADLPIVVAARLSLSFPLLFSAVPLWAIDHEAPPGERRFKRCQFTDGGVSSNFPIHLFDAALPRWPTFGLWLDRRTPYQYKKHGEPEKEVWLPKYHREGRNDNWNRFDPLAAAQDRPALTPGCKSRAKFLFGFLGAIAISTIDWRDRTSLRLPHVRNRVARLLLLPHEGGLNIGMSRERILGMAHRYGTKAGLLFVERFAEVRGEPSAAWNEQRWVRMTLLINSLRERLAGLSTAVAWAAHSVPLNVAIDRAGERCPIRGHQDCKRLEEPQAESLHTLLSELQRLEVALSSAEAQPFKPVPEPELRLRAPL
jgi:predicted acylesterase/phospholipase RssA